MRIKMILFATLFLVGCFETPTATTPAPVDIDIDISFGETPPEETPPSSAVSVALSPTSITAAVGQVVNVTVTARENGQEIPSSNITVSILDATIARFAGRTDRTIQIQGLAVGTTEAIVTAAGAQATLPITVTQ